MAEVGEVCWQVGAAPNLPNSRGRRWYGGVAAVGFAEFVGNGSSSDSFVVEGGSSSVNADDSIDLRGVRHLGKKRPCSLHLSSLALSGRALPINGEDLAMVGGFTWAQPSSSSSFQLPLKVGR